MKYAHIETGAILDPTPAADEGTYLRLVGGASDTSKWKIVQVPDNAPHGSVVVAVSNGVVTQFTPPPGSPKQDPKPIGMSGKEFTTYCGMTLAAVGKTSFQGGLERFDAILAAVETSDGKMMTLVRKTFQAALAPGGKFTYDDAGLLFPYIVANGAAATMTADEATALLAAWQRQ